MLVDAVAYGDHTVETALEKIRDKCRRMASSESTMTSGEAALTANNKRRGRNEEQRLKDRNEGNCFYCHKPGHLISKCPLTRENKIPSKAYSARARKVWLFDCGATKHFSNTSGDLMNIRSIARFGYILISVF